MEHLHEISRIPTSKRELEEELDLAALKTYARLQQIYGKDEEFAQPFGLALNKAHFAIDQLTYQYKREYIIAKTEISNYRQVLNEFKIELKKIVTTMEMEAKKIRTAIAKQQRSTTDEVKRAANDGT